MYKACGGRGRPIKGKRERKSKQLTTSEFDAGLRAVSREGSGRRTGQEVSDSSVSPEKLQPGLWPSNQSHLLEQSCITQGQAWASVSHCVQFLGGSSLEEVEPFWDVLLGSEKRQLLPTTEVNSAFSLLPQSASRTNLLFRAHSQTAGPLHGSWGPLFGRGTSKQVSGMNRSSDTARVSYPQLWL